MSKYGLRNKNVLDAGLYSACKIVHINFKRSFILLVIYVMFWTLAKRPDTLY